MMIEMDFLASRIGKAENRLAFQAALVARLPEGCASKQAVSACEVLQAMSQKVIALHQERNKQLSMLVTGMPARAG